MSCNGTTFAIEIANLNFKKAFQTHPIFFMSLIYLALMNFIYIVNVIFNKQINIFKWWHAIVWLILLLIYTIIRNLN